MEKILELFNSLDKLGEKIPKLDNVMDYVLKLMKLAVRVGPMVILILGLIYLLIPPKEANRKAGYRTFFGMGSLAAWRFTQFVSGLIMTISGFILNTQAKILTKSFDIADPEPMLQGAFDAIKTQIKWAIFIYIFMWLITALIFNIKGDIRFKALRGTLLEKLLFDEEPFRLMIKTFKSGKSPEPVKKSDSSAPKAISEGKRSSAKPASKPSAKPASKPSAKPASSGKKKSSGRPERRTPPAMGQAHEQPQMEENFERQGEQTITADDIIIEGL